MSRAVVVFESMFGNTEQVARAVALGVSGHVPVELVAVDEAPARLQGDVELLVVGGPTHTFGLSRSSTRSDAGKYGEDGAGVGSERGVREWLKMLEQPRPGTKAAAFSTMVATPRWIRYLGSAARSAARRLSRAGFRLATGNTADFYVSGMTGPLLPGELERARAWGEELGRKASTGGGRSAGSVARRSSAETSLGVN